MTAVMQRATHADAVIEKTVRYDTLTPLAAMREKLLYDLELSVQVGDFIFFLTPMPAHNGPSARMTVQYIRRPLRGRCSEPSRPARLPWPSAGSATLKYLRNGRAYCRSR